MPDSVAERRKRGKPERAKPMNKDMASDLDALREAGVPQEVIAKTLSRRFGSVAAQRAALRKLAGKQAGEHAEQLKGGGKK